MEKITIKLTIEEINKIMTALGQMPYVQVYELVASIQQQVTEQVNPEIKK
jgi:hypothetical protein